MNALLIKLVCLPSRDILDGLSVPLHILSITSILDQIQVLLKVVFCLCIHGLLLHIAYMQTACCGILKGLGRQFMGAIGNFVAFYIFGLPLGIFLAQFVKMGALGMWIGFATAGLVQVSSHVHTPIHSHILSMKYNICILLYNILFSVSSHSVTLHCKHSFKLTLSCLSIPPS